MATARSPRRPAPKTTPRRRPRAAKPAKARPSDWLKTPGSVRPEDVKRVVDAGAAKADTLLESAFKHVSRLAKQAKAAWEMVMAWWHGEYEAPWATIASVTAALLYFIGPFDFIPDFLPVIGFLDDATIMAFVIHRVQGDLKRFAAAKGRSLRDVGLAD
jgi:uncharacterized membrane protein YkvA (DUF1232 family)